MLNIISLVAPNNYYDNDNTCYLYSMNNVRKMPLTKVVDTKTKLPSDDRKADHI
jgi:hypothetical protein